MRDQVSPPLGSTAQPCATPGFMDPVLITPSRGVAMVSRAGQRALGHAVRAGVQSQADSPTGLHMHRVRWDVRGHAERCQVLLHPL